MKIEPGDSTAHPFNVHYRIGRIANYLDGGDWLDYGCADGGYTQALLESGAARASGIDVDVNRIEAARQTFPDISFYARPPSGGLPFPDHSFDGVFMNEVFEHVADERETLEEIHQLLRPGGLLIIISPNRGVSLRGAHRAHWTLVVQSSDTADPMAAKNVFRTDGLPARNYWPGELCDIVSSSAFAIVESGFIMPVFEGYPWLPTAAAERFRRHITRIDDLPLVRRLGVSNLVSVYRHPWTGATSI